MGVILRFHTMRTDQRSLIWTAAAVTAVHFVLLIGLPLWKFTQPTGSKGLVMVTRAISLPAPETIAAEPTAELAPSPAEAAPILVAEAPKAQPAPKPKPKPRRKPKPRPKAPVHAEQQMPEMPSTKVVDGPQGAGESSLLEIYQGFVAGPVNYWISVQTQTTGAEDAVITDVMENDAGQRVILPRSARISYATSGSVDGASYSELPTTLEWHHDGRHYSLNSEFLSTLAGDRHHFTHGVITAQGVAPVVSTEILEHERHDFRFDYANRQIAGGADTMPMEFKPGTQDHLSLMVQLAALVAAHKKDLAPGTVLSVPVLEPGGIHELAFSVLGEEMLTALEGKSVKTVHLAHRASEDKRHIAIETWLAPSLDYLPARWRVLNSNGDMQDQVARQAIALQAHQPDEAR